jgi:rubrerythrin
MEKLLEILSQAMQVEIDGYQFYKLASEKTTDTKGKEVFLSLAEDEKKHYHILKGQYEKVRKTSSSNPIAPVPSSLKISGKGSKRCILRCRL